MRALDTMVQHGHVRYVGVSNWAAWQITKALGISERLGLARFESLQAYYTIAGQRGTSVAQVALAWLLHQPQVTSVIIGAKKAEQLADNIGATKVALGADELKRLDAVSRLPSEYPGWMFTRQGEVRRKQLAEAKPKSLPNRSA